MGWRASTLWLIVLTLTVALTPAEAGEDPGDHVVINEVFYDAPTGWPEPEAEWIELYNPTASDVDVSGWRITDDPDPGGGDEGAYEFPPGAVIRGNSYLILAHSGDEFYLRYGFYPDYELVDTLPEVPNLIEVNSGMSLANAGDDVHLFDASLAEVDAVWYGGGGDLGPTNAAPDVDAGHSIERDPPGRDTDNPAADFVDRYPPTPTHVVSLTLRAVLEDGSGLSGVRFTVDGSVHSTGPDGSLTVYLPAGAHSVSAPTAARVDSSLVIFLGWGDGSPDDDRGVSLSGDLEMTATFANVSEAVGIPDLGAEVDHLGSELSELRGRVDALEASLSDLEGRLEGLASDLEVGSELSELRGRVDALEASLSDLEGRLEGLASDLEGVEADLRAIDYSINADEIRLAEIGSEVESMLRDLRGLSASLDSIEENLSTISGELEEIRGTPRVSPEELSSLEARISALEGALRALNASLGAAEESLSELSERVSTLETVKLPPTWPPWLATALAVIAIALSLRSLATRS